MSVTVNVGALPKVLTPAQDGAQSSGTVFGREYLAAWLVRIRGGLQGKVVLSGDSTTFGTGLEDADYQLDVLLPKLAVKRGWWPYSAAATALVSCTNRGQSGKSAYQWVTEDEAPGQTWVEGDILEAPHLYILRWGLNDPAQLRSPAQTISDIRTGLATIRATHDLATASILLMSPNSTNAAPRDAQWHRTINDGLRQAAADYQCCYIDTYSLWNNSADSSASWMDDIGGGAHVHPRVAYNLCIASAMAEVLFPLPPDPSPGAVALGANWTGTDVKVRRRGDVVHVTGLVKATGAPVVGEIICTLTSIPPPPITVWAAQASDSGYGAVAINSSSQVTYRAGTSGAEGWMMLHFSYVTTA